MPILKGYSDILVVQRKLDTGCIPAGIEWMLRYLKISGIDFSDFQERYDLGATYNSFGTIANLIMQAHPQVKLLDKSFQFGREKIDFIRHLISKGTPALISIALSDADGWHIMPVVEIDEQKMVMLTLSGNTITEQTATHELHEIELRHNEWNGGKDIMYWRL